MQTGKSDGMNLKGLNAYLSCVICGVVLSKDYSDRGGNKVACSGDAAGWRRRVKGHTGGLLQIEKKPVLCRQ